MRERGLKFLLYKALSSFTRRSREGAWIEIIAVDRPFSGQDVAPVRERGLKCEPIVRMTNGVSRSREGAWIEIPSLP